ncbi:MAG: FtsQ-type POTRA domain-containing protein [Clostridia bacterium]|nr:FtsQ-type POTRA domain-containing protein [Clostridia bacterium]
MKKTIIASTLLITFIALITVLFSVVFCLRQQSVTFLDQNITYSKDEILSTAGLKNGESIFMIDKDKAIENIESTYPDLKVVHISTTSLTKIDIRVKKRHELFYIQSENKYYILDQDLKVLDILSSEPSLIKIDLEYSKAHKKGDFILTDKASITADLFVAVYTTMLESEGADAYNEMGAKIEKISFSTAHILTGEYGRIIITLKSGIQFDIGRPNINLQNKLNICYHAMLTDDVDDTTGIVRIYYDADGTEHFGYFTN